MRLHYRVAESVLGTAAVLMPVMPVLSLYRHSRIMQFIEPGMVCP